ncbi:MAG: hypothetical protein Q9160_003717 [Pyrenula sp. 1 TL-2023]
MTEASDVIFDAQIWPPLDVSKNQTRLLTIASSEDESAQICCDSRTVDFESSDTAHYEALSYAWGDPSSPKHCILVNGCKFHIWDNLYKALRRLRYRTEPRVIWVDAICIHQTNAKEKDHQIRRMHSVFNNASRVLVWLEESDEEVDKAMDMLEDLGKKWREIIDSDPRVMLTMCKDVLPGLNKILNRSWWERIWMVQEVSLAKECPLVLCGTRTASFEVLYTLKFQLYFSEVFGQRNAENLRIDSDSFAEMIQIPFQWGGDQRRSGEDSDIFARFLDATSSRLSTDPRDKIFALLGLVSTNYANDVFPDYDQPLSRLYQQATVCMLQAGAQDSCLSYTTKARRTDLPSWCVDFSGRWKFRDKCFLADENIRPDVLSQIPQAPIVRDEEHDAIEARGFILGTVNLSVQRQNDFGREDMTVESLAILTDRELQNTSTAILHDFCSSIHPFATAVFAILQHSLGLEQASETIATGHLWKLFAHSQDAKVPYYAKQWLKDFWEDFSLIESHACKHQPSWQQASVQQPWTRRFGAGSKFLRHLRWKALSLRDPVLTESPEFRYSIWQRVTSLILNVKGCSFFTTSDTVYYGKATGMVQEGDLLCLLSVADFPTILRPRGQSFELVAFAWIPGLEEYTQFSQFGELAEKDFHLV